MGLESLAFWVKRRDHRGQAARRQAANTPRWRVAAANSRIRGGTTLLEQVLDAHPDLVSSEERNFVARERPVNSSTYEDVARPVYTTSIGRWRHYEE